MSRPRLAEDFHPAAGLAAVALLVVMAAVFLTAAFGESVGLPGDVSITASIGYAMFDLVGQVPDGIETEGFLFAFLTIALVLDAALGGAIMLAHREGEQSARSMVTDGGRETGGEEE